MGRITSNSAGPLPAAAADAAAPASPHSPPQDSPPQGLNKPVVVIEPRRSWLALELRELWNYRELLYFLVWRDVKVRYKQTLLGVLWAVLQPLFMMLVFSFFFGRLAGIKSDGVPYPLFAYAALLPWTFFSTAALASGNSMVNSSHLLTKVYFPRLIVPTAAAGVALVDFAVSFAVLGLLMVYYRVEPTAALLALPLLAALLVLLALGFGVLMAALNVRYRDVRLAMPFVFQLWFFATPIIYPTSMLPERLRALMALNPLTGIIEGFRVALYAHKPFDWPSLLVSVGVTLALLAVAAVTFKRMEKSFADIV
jgi:lipopolysaccharide transport system permease protein